ncbi:MAG: alpha-xylosidase [Prevotella sp.]|nr:alpha-xylosidase [Prevotella sp.]MBQ9186857.1 alpha-xylosidase [Prevotella sp.]MBR1388034.1 alpha-xylosidase [Prevotella sp.]
MKQTNYHLFDFMDFDSSMERNEALWKAYAPTKIEERDGDIVVTIPYQKQLHQEDMAPDTSEPQQSFDLVIRAYEPNIIRLFTTMAGDKMTESDDMLLFAPEVKRLPLRYVGCDVIAANGKKVTAIDLTPPKLDYWSDLLPAPQPAPFITFYPDGDETKGIALSDDHFSPPRYDALPLGFCSVNSGNAAVSQNERATISFRCLPNECFVGTGERFRKMDLSGQTFQLKNQDGQGVNNRRCYKNIPFFLSSRMYGCFYHTSDYCKLSLADHSTRSVQFMCDRATLDVFLIGGQTPEEILRGYRMLTGFPQMPPRWSFGIWMSRMTYFSADEVNAICNRLRAEHYPCDVIHLDTGWFRTDWLCEWKFNPERFPDPQGFIKQLASNGYKVSLWQLPYIAAGAEQIEEAKSNQYISQPSVVGDSVADTTSDSSNFSTLDYAGTIDFTYDKATNWYKYQLLKPLLDMGVKCIKTDFGENIHMNHRYHGMEPERLNNIYALLYQRAAYEVTKEVTGDGIVWARSAWAGCQRYPLHWGGDSESSWAGMAGSLKGGLHFGLSGFAFWSHDVPGFHSSPDFMNSPLDEQVYVRWTQFGVFSSHMRYHGTSKREPWHYPAIAPIIKQWWKLRYKLLPYIIEQGELSCRSGYPMLRALLFHHPHDRQCWNIDDEYYFGTDFLVCPVMSSDNRRDFYLPEGLWVNFFTGQRLHGGQWYYNVEVPLDQMLVFVRPGALIRLYPDDVDNTDQMDLSKAITIEITKEYKGLEIS